jgi:hypothetical protein
LVTCVGGEGELIHALAAFSFDANDFFAWRQGETVALVSPFSASPDGAKDFSIFEPLKLNGIHMRPESDVNAQQGFSCAPFTKCVPHCFTIKQALALHFNTPK